MLEYGFTRRIFLVCAHVAIRCGGGLLRYRLRNGRSSIERKADCAGLHSSIDRKLPLWPYRLSVAGQTVGQLNLGLSAAGLAVYGGPTRVLCNSESCTPWSTARVTSHLDNSRSDASSDGGLTCIQWLLALSSQSRANAGSHCEHQHSFRVCKQCRAWFGCLLWLEHVLCICRVKIGRRRQQRLPCHFWLCCCACDDRTAIYARAGME